MKIMTTTKTRMNVMMIMNAMVMIVMMLVQTSLYMILGVVMVKAWQIISMQNLRVNKRFLVKHRQLFKT